MFDQGFDNLPGPGMVGGIISHPEVVEVDKHPSEGCIKMSMVPL